MLRATWLSITVLVGAAGVVPASASQAPVVSGKWTMTKTILDKSPNLDAAPADNVRFVFARDCQHNRCRTFLKTPLVRGGFDTDELFRTSTLRWRSRKDPGPYRCHSGRRYDGRNIEQYSLRVTASQVVDGVRYAAAADVYRREKVWCPQGTAFLVALYRGKRDVLPGG
jgi:hypothetical protein